VQPLPSQLAYELWQARRAEVERSRRQPARFASRRLPGNKRSLRASMGWFLVGLGLRLAAPRPPLSTVR
jgi:hypothetical protein